MEAGIAATCGLLAELAIRPGAMRLPVEFRKDERTFQDDLPKLDAAARFAASIGCPRMTAWVPASGELPKSEQRAVYKSRLGAVADVLARSNVRLGLENLGPLHLRRRFPHEFIYRTDEMLEFASECGSNVGILLDSWHWHHSGGTTGDILAAGAGHIVHVHVADVPDVPPDEVLDSERLMPGDGVADLVGFFQALAKSGYRGAVSPEVFGRGLGDMTPEDGAKLGLGTTREVMRCLNAS